MASSTSSYDSWPHEDLVRRVHELEQKLKNTNESEKTRTSILELEEDRASASKKSRPAKKPKTFDWSKHSTRFIALKFAYLGRRYNGFEHHSNNSTPLPTIEETLWEALMKAKLINPIGEVSSQSGAVNWEGCDYSKCGRTDKGVNAFGQVIGLRIRSNRPAARVQDGSVEESDPIKSVTAEDSAPVVSDFDDLNDELPYIQMLNGLLPSDIRILAWCPSPPDDFSARFSCRARHYKYFFTQPSFNPTPGLPGLRHGPSGANNAKGNQREGWLDIERMQDAAKRFEGLHDFRNFCKVDPSKQITDHRRRIYRSVIRPLTPDEQPAAYVSNPLFAKTAQASTNSVSTTEDSSAPSIYVFDLQGSAFLWHQVRHMIAILFLIGQGLEEPALIDRMLDAPHFPEKPMYDMADETPLVLWDCIFPGEGSDVDPLRDSLQWLYAGQNPSGAGDKVNTGVYTTKYGLRAALDTVWSLWRESEMDAILRGSLLNLIVSQPDVLTTDPNHDQEALSRKPYSQKVFSGGLAPRYAGTYIPVMKRERMRSIEEQNREYAAKHGIVPKTKTDGAPQESRGDHMDVEP